MATLVTEKPTGSSYQKSLEEWRLCMHVTASPGSAPPSSLHPPLGGAAFCHEKTPKTCFWNFCSGFGTFPLQQFNCDWFETLSGNDYRPLLWMGGGTADRCELRQLCDDDAKTASGLRPLSALSSPCHAACAAANAILVLLSLPLLQFFHVLHFDASLFSYFFELLFLQKVALFCSS